MNDKDLERLVATAVGDCDLLGEEIPSIDLYLDQVISLVTEKKEQASFDDRTLTGTMINNYSKDGLIAPIKGKKYSKEHIVQMLLIYSLKNTIPISAIRRILQGVYSEPCSFDGKKLAAGYDAFLALKESNREASLRIVRDMLKENELDIEDDFDFFVFLLGLISLSSYLKNISVSLLNERYPDLDEIKREELRAEKERLKAEKEAKKEAKQKAKKTDGKEETNETNS